MGKRVEVKFKKDYVASRGACISGAKGQKKVFPVSDDLDAVVKSGIVEILREIKPEKKSKAARRSKAVRAPDEIS